MTTVAVAGNPNSGKTTLVNQLTGLNLKVGNYPGITVERRSGTTTIGDLGEVTIVDIPGTYSLISRSRDEAIAFEALTGRTDDDKPDLTVIVLDATNLERNLYLALSILELGLPAIIALNMMDLLPTEGMQADVAALAEALGTEVVPVVAKKGEGIEALRAAIQRTLADPPATYQRKWQCEEKEEQAIEQVRAVLAVETEAIWLLSTLAVATKAETIGTEDDPLSSTEASEAFAVAKKVLPGLDDAFPQAVIEARYRIAAEIAADVITQDDPDRATLTDRLDGLFLHPIAGTLTFLLVMALLFQSIFHWAEPLMDLIDAGVLLTKSAVRYVLPAGVLSDLFADGVVGGVGNILVFLPQIAILFLFISLLEDSGYLARAAFLSDRLMARIGLHGRAFVPLLSGFACAVPAIMATRAIENRRDRLVTILVIPLVTCSARLPVYALIIAALFASDRTVLGFLSVGGLMLLAMYALSIAATIIVAFILKRTLLKSPTPPLVLELPPYRMPQASSVLSRVFERSKVFVRDAGTIILVCSVLLWGLLYFPRDVDQPRGTSQIEQSYAARVGRALEPLIKPLGYDWKIGVGLLSSFAAREVFISTMGLVYGIQEAEEGQSLREALRNERDPETGAPVYTPLVGFSLMVFFVFAAQCMSTFAIIRRETGSWRWPLFVWGYATVLAWIAAFIVFQGGRLLGLS